jgi:DNA-binding LacI/PurR family transcriptional regulator
VAFVGYGDPAFYRWIGGGVSTVALPVEALARRALDLVRPGSERPDHGLSETPPFETIFVVRGSS